MPYFMWQGINILGNIKRGRSFARSQDELATVLLKRDIALLKSKSARKPFIPRAISFTVKIQFFQQLAALLSAGILLPEALALVAAQIDHVRFQEIAYAITDSVYAGTSLHLSLAQYPRIFNPLMINVVHIGQETGRLATVCQALCAHLSMVQHFKQSVRTALMMPAITFGFFLVIALVILVWVVPSFVAIFSSFHQQLPYMTLLLISMSNSLRGLPILIAGLIGVLFILTLRVFVQSDYGRTSVDTCILRIPCIGRVLTDAARTHLVRSLAVLVHGGISVPLAIRISTGAISNSVLQGYARYLEHAVNTGSSLSQAMIQHPEQWFEQQVVAMIKVGEESGKLADALIHAADYYQQRVELYLAWCTALVQPLLIIILGILIAFFICAVYMPIFNVAHIM